VARVRKDETVYTGRRAAHDKQRVAAAYGEEKYIRLVALKNKFDPTSFFRFSQNIAPRS